MCNYVSGHKYLRQSCKGEEGEYGRGRRRGLLQCREQGSGTSAVRQCRAVSSSCSPFHNIRSFHRDSFVTQYLLKNIFNT